VREVSQLPPDDLLAIDEALQSLEQCDRQKAEVVKLRFFGGFSIPETAELMGISDATVKRHWTFARAWLFADLRDGVSDAPNGSTRPK